MTKTINPTDLYFAIACLIDANKYLDAALGCSTKDDREYYREKAKVARKKATKLILDD